MRRCCVAVFIVILCFLEVESQAQQEVDSLVNKMKTVHKEWAIYSEALIEIGEPAVCGLINNATDKNLKQWNRRISIETLNQIHSELWVKPALGILFDDKEIDDLRNRVTAGLRGFDLSEHKEKLWNLFDEAENTFYKSNLAHLLVNSDVELAYLAFKNLYENTGGHVQTSALLNLVNLREEEAITWYLKALGGDDWRTSQLATDSLVVSLKVKINDLITFYQEHESNEVLQWRVVHILGCRKELSTIPFLCSALRNNSWLVRTEAAVALSCKNAKLVRKELEALKPDSIVYINNNIKWIKARLRDNCTN